MKLIHVALFIEAKPLIQHYNLKQYDTKPFKIFKNDSIVLIVSGVGEANTNNALSQIFEKYEIHQAFNIGTAASGTKTIALNSLFCTNKRNQKVDFMPCKSVSVPQKELVHEEVLYDMESEFFIKQCEKYLDQKEIWVLKIVSDYCEDRVFQKEIVYNMVMQNIEKIAGIIDAN